MRDNLPNSVSCRDLIITAAAPGATATAAAKATATRTRCASGQKHSVGLLLAHLSRPCCGKLFGCQILHITNNFAGWLHGSVPKIGNHVVDPQIVYTDPQTWYPQFRETTICMWCGGSAYETTHCVGMDALRMMPGRNTDCTYTDGV